MSDKAKILICLDTDPQPSTFDSVVAVDAGVDHLFRHGGVSVDDVEGLIHGGMFTRGPQDLHRTAVFIGGSDVQAGEKVLAAARNAFFGPLRVSIMLDCGGANTTAAAAVIAAAGHLTLENTDALVLGATGPVGQRVARLLARARAKVRVASRQQSRADLVCQRVLEKLPDGKLTALQVDDTESLGEAARGVQLVIAAGAAGIELMGQTNRAQCSSLRVAIDLNAVPPAGIGGIEVTDAGRHRDGQVVYGAIGVGGIKMKIHKAALRELFAANDQVLDAEEIYELGTDVMRRD